MKALTIHPVWAWAIVGGHKPVENRTWRTHHRGPLLIHASADSRAARRSDVEARAVFELLGVEVPPDEEVTRGAIVGRVEVYDVVRYAPGDPMLLRLLRENMLNLLCPPEIDPEDLEANPLATGPFCWMLRNAETFARPIHMKGRQSLFEVEGFGIGD